MRGMHARTRCVAIGRERQHPRVRDGRGTGVCTGAAPNLVADLEGVVVLKLGVARVADGGDGRVRIDCTVCNGETQGTAAADAALNDAAAPDVGYSSTP